MADKKGATEQYYSPPPKLGKWEGFKLFLWNSETSQCLGRTGSSWAKIIFFYILFYSALAGFFAAMLAVFYQTLDNEKPKWQLDNGLIGSNPGLGFRPMPSEENVESTLIWYEANKPDNYKYWVDEINRFLSEYIDAPTQNSVNCSYEKPPPEGKVCGLNLTSFDQCTLEHGFGYNQGRPCIFLKLNKIYNWMPEMYNDSTALPNNIPDLVRQQIKTQEELKSKEVNTVWVSCAGENSADDENIITTDYFPRMGFPGYYFPFTNVDGYVPPLVAVQFNVKTGILINIECKAWAKNIHHDRSERRGSVHFELMVD